MKFKFDLNCFSLKRSLYSGQCFRFKEVEKNCFLVFSKGYSAYIKQIGNMLHFYDSTVELTYWKKYFNYYVNYEEIIKRFEGDLILEKLTKLCKGIRILKQDPFECLVSFIFSINNNIKRIQTIVEVLCENFGKKTKNGYSFPTAESLKGYTENDFKILKAGFRVKFLIDLIKKINLEKINLKELYSLSFLEAKTKLKKIYGVGEKVACCVLLFAYNKMQAFPVDVWIRRVLKEYYVDGVSKQVLSCPGLAQQLLFYGKRNGYI